MSFERFAAWCTTVTAAEFNPGPSEPVTWVQLVLIGRVACVTAFGVLLAGCSDTKDYEPGQCSKSIVFAAVLVCAAAGFTLLWSAHPLTVTSATACELLQLPQKQGVDATMSLATVACDAEEYGSVVSEAHGLLWPMIRARLLKQVSSGKARIRIGNIQVRVQHPPDGRVCRMQCVPLWVVYW